MALPDTFSELYPGRFLKADMLKGKKVTLTIREMDVEELESEKKKEPKVICKFLERPLELVMPKTNGFCLKRMFGNNPQDWVGKRITIFPSTTKFGRETVDCIRIWGSPDLSEDLEITVPQGRKKALEMVMHSVKVKVAAPPKPAPVSSKVEELFALNASSAAQRTALLNKFADDEAGLMDHLETELSRAES